MKISDVIDKCNRLYTNDFSDGDKILWCDDIGTMIYASQKSTYDVLPYEKITNLLEEQTVAPSPYDEMYVEYLIAKCCYYNRDFEAYNQHMNLFNSIYQNYQNWFIRNNKPKTVKIEGWF